VDTSASGLLDIYIFYYYHLVDTSASGLLVPEGIIHPVVCALTLTLFVQDILMFEIYSSCIMYFIKTKVKPSGIGNFHQKHYKDKVMNRTFFLCRLCMYVLFRIKKTTIDTFYTQILKKGM